jgi:hypothetical protein
MPKPQDPGTRTRSRTLRPIFFAQRERIRASVERGEYLIDIHRETGFPGSYCQFTRYVARYVRLPAPRVLPAGADMAQKGQPRLRPDRLMNPAGGPRRHTSGPLAVDLDATKLNRKDVIGD